MQIKHLNIQGYGDLGVPNTFFEQDSVESRKLAVIFPGLGYGAFMPVLYYPGLVMRSAGADVLHVEYNYNSPVFQALSSMEQYQRIAHDCTAAYRAAEAQHAYSYFTLIGKSLGTLALGHLLATGPTLRHADWIWLTPLLRNQALRQQICSVPHHALFVIGTADQHYDAGLLAEIEQAVGGESLVVEGANHSLEIPGNPLASIQIMQQVIQKIEAFVHPDTDGVS